MDNVKQNKTTPGTHKSPFGDIHYELLQSEDKPMVVFIHGVGMDHRTFDLQVKALQSDYSVLVWDLPGHGKSTLKNYNKRFTRLSAECLNGLIEELKIPKAFFVGQSLGSMIVQHFERMYPEKGAATIHVPGIRLKSHIGPWAKKLVPSLMFMLKLIPANMFYSAFGKHRAEKKEVQDYLSETMRRTGKKLALKITEDMVYDLIDQSPAPQNSPSLITYGKKDLFFIRNAAEQWHKEAPGSKCVEIQSANHIANQDNPEAFNKALIGFLKSLTIANK
ncbi:alpha/beta hydrolase [Litoribacter ruber]|uniref:alpha/beta fold hydrolase n=1 Tax=Litoribacter ruber TaxID=702568 RepID=UPI001BD9B242|nr:alpha/beta hydrolase [Litoribacter ruber]MBT0811115.1 alpha/beta hydrolase [Litoribacter ruber]